MTTKDRIAQIRERLGHYGSGVEFATIRISSVDVYYLLTHITELESVLGEAGDAMKEPLEFQGTMRGEKHNSVLRMRAVLTKLEKTLGEGE